jgi:hypothetical protein
MFVDIKMKKKTYLWMSLIVVALIIGGVIGHSLNSNQSGNNGNLINGIAQSDLLKGICKAEGDQYQGCNPSIQGMAVVNGIQTYQIKCCDGEITLIPSQLFCFGNRGMN